MHLVRCAAVLFAASGVIWNVATASAVTYNYVGGPDPNSGNYLTASVDLNCVGPCRAGSHGIKSFSLSAYSKSDALLTTVSSADLLFLSPALPVFEFNFFLSLDDRGAVTNWSLYRYGETAAGDTIAIATMGFSPPGLAEVADPLASGEFAYLKGTFLLWWNAPPGSTDPPVGVWTRSEVPLHATSSEVPLPAALPLFATIVAGGGLIAWRRKRKVAAALQ